MGDDGLNWILGALAEQMAQFFLFHAEQIGYPLAAGQHTNGSAGIRMSLDVVEHHGRAVHPGWAHHGAACAHIAVHAGKLCFRVHFYIRFHELARCLAQHVQCGAQV